VLLGLDELELELVLATRRLARPVLMEADEVLTEAGAVFDEATAPGKASAA
jgi:hypothetical protein